jgi:hypothetical protein
MGSAILATVYTFVTFVAAPTRTFLAAMRAIITIFRISPLILHVAFDSGTCRLPTTGIIFGISVGKTPSTFLNLSVKPLRCLQAQASKQLMVNREDEMSDPLMVQQVPMFIGCGFQTGLIILNKP